MRKRRNVSKFIPLEWLEARTMLSAGPVTFEAFNTKNTRQLKARVPKLLSQVETINFPRFVVSSHYLETPEVLGSFKSDLDASKISATIDWGDGSAPTVGTVETFGKPWKRNKVTVYSILGAHDYQTVGKYEVKVSITVNAPLGKVMATGTTTGDVRPAPLPPPPSPPPPSTTPIYPNLIPPIYVAESDVPLKDIVIDWGDGTEPSNGYISRSPAVSSRFIISGQHIYRQVGDYAVKITATNAQSGATVNIEGRATVHDATYPPTFEFLTPSIVPHINLSSLQIVAGIPDYGLYWSGQAINLATGNVPMTDIMIDWGDGSDPTPGTYSWGVYGIQTLTYLSEPFKTTVGYYTYRGNHTYAIPGIYTVTLTGRSAIEDPVKLPGGVYTFQLQLKVTQNSSKGTTIYGVAQEPTILEWAFAAATTIEMTGSIDWGDGTIESVVVTRMEIAGRTTYHVSSQHTYAEPGTYRVTVVARRTQGSLGVMGYAYSTAVIEPTV